MFEQIVWTLFLRWLYNKTGLVSSENEEEEEEVEEEEPGGSSTSAATSKTSTAIINSNGKGRKTWAAPPLIRSPFFGSNLEIKSFTVSAECNRAFRNRALPRTLYRQEELCIENYATLFHNWLWMEEKHMATRRKSFRDIQVMTKFRNKDCYFTVEVKDVDKFRPALDIGDNVCAFNHIDKMDPIFKGPIFHINYEIEKVLIRFPSKFSEFYDGVPLAISFEFNRQSLILLHNAIEVAVESFPKWLFPTAKRFKLKDPLIIFTETEGKPTRIAPEKKEDEESSLFKSKRPSRDIVIIDPDQWQLNKFLRDGGVRLKICDDWYSPHPEPLTQIFDAKLTWINPRLREGQKTAVKHILQGVTRPYPFILKGGHSSGKTTALLEAIAQVSLLNKSARILVATGTDLVADNITLKLLQTKRVGSLTRFILFTKRRENEPKEIGHLVTNPCAYVKAINQRVVVTTCKAAGFFLTLSRRVRIFTHVFIDDAHLCSEPETLIPIILANMNGGAQIILAGNERVFPTTYDTSRKNLLRKSLFHRLLDTEIYNAWENDLDFLVQNLNQKP